MTIRRELLDELLKEYETLKAHPGRRRTAQRIDQSGDRTVPGDGTGEPLGLPQACTQGKCQRQQSQWA
jgi:hypothetical protein